MTVIDVRKDPENLTMEVTCEFAAPADQVWELWADPRKLERWWGPPMFPATFVGHELKEGGVMTYFMTSPEGERHHGWWRVLAVDPGRSLEVRDGFGEDPDGPTDGLPSTRMRVTMGEIGDGRTRMVIESHFPTIEALEQLLAMGVEEGLKLALGQIDDILASEVVS